MTRHSITYLLSTVAVAALVSEPRVAQAQGLIPRMVEITAVRLVGKGLHGRPVVFDGNDKTPVVQLSERASYPRMARDSTRTHAMAHALGARLGSLAQIRQCPSGWNSCTLTEDVWIVTASEPEIRDGVGLIWVSAYARRESDRYGGVLVQRRLIRVTLVNGQPHAEVYMQGFSD